MQMITDLFKALSDIFRIVSKTTTTIEVLVDQTNYSLSDSRDEAAAKLIASRKARKIDQAALDQLNKDIYGR